MKKDEQTIVNLQKALQYEKEQNEKLRKIIAEKDREILRLGGYGDINKEREDQSVKPVELKDVHLNFFWSYFFGRTDAYAKQAKNENFYIACRWYWKDNCPKKSKEKGQVISCESCKLLEPLPVEKYHLINHLKGYDIYGNSFVMAQYPLLDEGRCRYICMDFDDLGKDGIGDNPEYRTDHKEWKEEVNDFNTFLTKENIPYILERTQNGQGAHIWIFFEEKVLVKDARKLMNGLITKYNQINSQRNLRLYDRLLPNQDNYSERKYGLPIALPLQGGSLEKGNSVFVDRYWNAYENQWTALKNTKKISAEFLEEKIKELPDFHLATQLSIGIEENGKEDLKRSISVWNSSMIHGDIIITLTNSIRIQKNQLQPFLQEQIRNLATYGNPEYYKNRALGKATSKYFQFVDCSYELDDEICIPRGCLDILLKKLKQAKINYELNDEREKGQSIHVEFNGTLREHQIKAMEVMKKYDTGVLSSATASGKTVMSAYMISERKVNTLIIVNTKKLQTQWIESLEKYLTIHEDPLTYVTPTGRIKKRKNAIGALGGTSAQNQLGYIIDVAIDKSIHNRIEDNEFEDKYGMVIVDECQNAATNEMQEILSFISSKYVYGVSATPFRYDNQDKKIFYQCGPIRHVFSTKDLALSQEFDHLVYPRFTKTIEPFDRDIGYSGRLDLIADDKNRNKLITEDVIECIRQKRSVLILASYTNHVDILYEMLKDKADHVLKMTGKIGTKKMRETEEELKSIASEETLILIGTGKYIGTGFDCPRLDTLMLATPCSDKALTTQYIGRLNRDYPGKISAVVYDYVDIRISQFERMFAKRARIYKSLGYEIVEKIGEKQSTNSVYYSDTYLNALLEDLEKTEKTLIICSPFLHNKVTKKLSISLLKLIRENVKIQIYTMDPASCDERYKVMQKELIEFLQNEGIIVRTDKHLSERVVMIDQHIVWYGTFGIMSNPSKDDNVIRYDDKEMASLFFDVLEERKNHSLQMKMEI